MKLKIAGMDDLVAPCSKILVTEVILYATMLN